MSYILHNGSIVKKIKCIVKNLNFEKEGVEKEGGYYVYRVSDENIEKISNVLNSDDTIEIYKIIVHLGKFIKYHLHNTSTEFFLGESSFEIFVNEIPVLVDCKSILGVFPKMLHKTVYR